MKSYDVQSDKENGGAVPETGASTENQQKKSDLPQAEPGDAPGGFGAKSAVNTRDAGLKETGGIQEGGGAGTKSEGTEGQEADLQPDQELGAKDSGQNTAAEQQEQQQGAADQGGTEGEQKA